MGTAPQGVFTPRKSAPRAGGEPDLLPRDGGADALRAATVGGFALVSA
ncbi:hypothetical protein [Streptomyces sp. HNM1019]